jgi:hypothetical protein
VRRFDAGCVVRAGDIEGLSDALASLKGLRGRSAARGVREQLAQRTREQLAKRTIDCLKRSSAPVRSASFHLAIKQQREEEASTVRKAGKSARPSVCGRRAKEPISCG